MIGWKKPKSLKDHLVSAKIKCGSSSDNKSALCCRCRESYCQHSLNTSIPNGLNKRFVGIHML